jgi:ClpP class serine protease
MNQMLLRADLSEKLSRVHRAVGAPTAQQRAEFTAARAARPKYASGVPGARPALNSDPENYAVVGNVAQICIEGVLSEEPDFWAWLMGCDGTTYKDIRDAFALAAADPIVKSIVLDVSSPGGYADGLFETLASIEAFAKPGTVQASEACSAAYALAAMAGPITPKGPASSFGSIGVAMDFRFSNDIEYLSLTSTEAPNKRPDPRTAEGKAIIVAGLDATHELFVDAIARGRSRATGKDFTVDRVNADFGRGGTLLADAAKAAGLIDKAPPRAPKRNGPSAESGAIGDETPAPAPAAETNTRHATEAPVPAGVAANQPSPPCAAGQENKKVTKMTKKELLAQFPELHAELLADGVTQERDRVEAHLAMGEASGDMKLAVASIVAGDQMTQKLSAKYMAASMGRRETTARQEESDEAGKILGGAPPPSGAGGTPVALDNSDLVAAAMNLPAPAKVA